MLNIAIPSPSQYIRHRVVEEIATECNKLYRKTFNNSDGCPVDVESFIDIQFQINILVEYLDEPEDTIVFAQFSSEEGSECITINEKHQPLFDSRPEILRSTLGHELAHYILRHYELLQVDNKTLSLFPDQDIKKIKPQNLHRCSWQQYGLSKDDITELVKHAHYSDTARQLLSKLNDGHFCITRQKGIFQEL